jgi:hypothetical protein
MGQIVGFKTFSAAYISSPICNGSVNKGALQGSAATIKRFM